MAARQERSHLMSHLDVTSITATKSVLTTFFQHKPTSDSSPRLSFTCSRRKPLTEMVRVSLQSGCNRQALSNQVHGTSHNQETSRHCHNPFPTHHHTPEKIGAGSFLRVSAFGDFRVHGPVQEPFYNK